VTQRLNQTNSCCICLYLTTTIVIGDFRVVFYRKMFVAFKLRKYTEKYYQLQKEQERNNSTLLPRAGEEGAIVNDCEKRYKNVQNGETFIQLRLSVRHAHCSSHIIDRRHGEQTAAAISNQLVFSTRNRPHNCKQLSCCWRSAGLAIVPRKKTNVLATTARLCRQHVISGVRIL